ncbi:MAG: hypothetical protein V3S69_04175 [Dehalococcoidales bacterium]
MSQWLDKLKEYAPSIASAVLSGGVTLPQLAYKAISDATGLDIKSMGDAQAAVESATDKELLALKQADHAFELANKKLDNDLVSTELDDIQDARDSHKHSVMPAVICCSLTAMVAALMVALFKYEVPEANSSIVYMVIGQVITLWGGSVVYFIGTTRSSAVKTAAMLKR